LQEDSPPWITGPYEDNWYGGTILNTVVTILTLLSVWLVDAVGQAWCKDVAQRIETYLIHPHARKRRYIHLKRVVGGFYRVWCVTAAGLRTMSKPRTQGRRGVSDGTCPPPFLIKSLHRTHRLLSYHHSRSRRSASSRRPVSPHPWLQFPGQFTRVDLNLRYSPIFPSWTLFLSSSS